MNAITLLADLRRRIDNLLRLGTVEAVLAGECRVKSGELLTDWWPYFTQRAGIAEYLTYDIGDESIVSIVSVNNGLYFHGLKPGVTTVTMHGWYPIDPIVMTVTVNDAPD